MKEYGVTEIELHKYLTPVWNGHERSASLPGRFTPNEDTATYCIGVSEGPRVGLAAVETLLALLAHEPRFQGRPPRLLVAICTERSRLPFYILGLYTTGV
jgi:hypothetical protein